MIRDVRSLQGLTHHLVATESNCRTVSAPLDNGLLHYIGFDQIFKVQHLPFECFGICLTWGKFPSYKEKKMLLHMHIHKVSNKTVTKTDSKGTNYWWFLS